MAEPARDLDSSGNVNVPANDNSSSLRGASLRLLQGDRSRVVKRNKNQPTLHPLSQMQLARDLQESQEYDRMNVAGDDSVSDDTLKSASDADQGGSVLDLEPQSYTSREETPAQSEAARQRMMARVGARFLHPEAKQSVAGEGDGESSEYHPKIRRRTSSGARGNSERMIQDRFAEQIQSDRRRMMMRRDRDAEGSAMDQLANAGQTSREAKRLYQLVMKIVELESVVLAIWVLIALNIETWNILLFRKQLPAALNSKLNMIGLNIDVDPRNPFTPMNLVVIWLTLLVDILLTLYVLMQVAFFLFIIYWLFKASSVLNMMGISL